MRIIFLLCFIFIASCVPSNAKEKILDIQEVTSAKGIKAWLVEDSSLPIITLKFSFKEAGAINDGKDKQGLSRLLSNTMDEGAGDLTSQEFQKALSDHSISLRFSADRDNFGGSVRTLSRHKDKAFNLLTLALTKPRFDAEPLERMRDSNLARIRSSMGDPSWISARLFNDIAFAGHPYTFNSGGTLTTLKNITADDLRAHVKDFLTQDRLVIGVTGNINAEELGPLLDKVFGALPKTGKQDNFKKHTIQNTGKTFLYTKDIPQTIISKALPAIDQNDPDYYSLRVMNYIFGGGGFGSRLMEEVREKRGLTYGIHASLIHQDYLDGITISTSTKNASVNEINDVIDNEIQRIITQSVSQQELQDAKFYITGSMPLSLTSTNSVASILHGLQLNNRPVDYLDQFSDKINAVTADDIQRVAKRIFDQKPVTILVGQPENINNVIEVKKIPNVE